MLPCVAVCCKSVASVACRLQVCDECVAIALQVCCSVCTSMSASKASVSACPNSTFELKLHIFNVTQVNVIHVDDMCDERWGAGVEYHLVTHYLITRV